MSCLSHRTPFPGYWSCSVKVLKAPFLSVYVCVCLHFVAILASKIPALRFCYQCKSSCWILFLLYVFSLAANVFAECKMAQYPGGPAPETHTLSFHAHTCRCWHACFRSNQTAKHSTRDDDDDDDDACSWKWRVSPLHLSSPEILTLNRQRFVFAQRICLFVCLFYLMSLFFFGFGLFFYKCLYLYLTLGM